MPYNAPCPKPRPSAPAPAARANPRGLGYCLGPDFALFIACRAGNEEAARLALAHGARPDFEQHPGGLSAFTFAGALGAAGCLRAMLEAGADPDALDGAGHSALTRACEKGREEAARLLGPLSTVRRPPPCPSKGQKRRTALMRAAAGDHAGCVVSELRFCDPSETDDQGLTALDIALRGGCHKAVAAFEARELELSAEAPLAARGPARL